MPDIALFEAKNRLSELIDRVLAGESFTITRRGRVVARLSAPDSTESAQRALDAIARVQAARAGVSLGRSNSRALVREGRR